jgi:hypothetical protein
MNNTKIKITVINKHVVSAIANGNVELFIEDAAGIHVIIPKVITREEMDKVVGMADLPPVVPRLTEAEHNRFEHGRFA